MGTEVAEFSAGADHSCHRIEAAARYAFTSAWKQDTPIARRSNFLLELKRRMARAQTSK